MRSTTLLPLLATIIACDGASSEEAHATCEEYLSCLSTADPAVAAGARDLYAEDGSCWSDGADAEACAAECADGIGAQHVVRPWLDECDDGSPVPSNTVIVDTDWDIRTTSAEGNHCDAFFADTVIGISFEPNDETTFPGTLENLSALQLDIVGECNNDGVEVECLFVNQEGDLVFEAVLDDSLTTFTGEFDYGGECTWTF